MLATRAAIRMPDRNQEEHYQEMLMKYTHTHEQPEAFGMVRAPTEYEESENEVLHLVDPPLDRVSLPPSDHSPPSTGAAMLTSLLGRFSISRFLRPGPTICPKDLSPIPEAPLSATHTKRNAVTPEAAPMLSSLLRGEPSLPSSFAPDDGKGHKRRRYNDENDSDSGSGSDSDWEPGVVARHRNNGSTRRTSRRNNAPRASAWRASAPPKLTARDGKVLIRGASRGGRAPILESSRVLHPTQLEGGLPTGDFTFEKTLRPARFSGHNIPSATFEHAEPASSRHSSMEVDDMAPSIVSDLSSLTPSTPPPTELQYPDTDVEVEEDETTLILPGVRRSKMTALLRLKQSASPDPGTPYTETSPDVEMGEDDADGFADSDGDDGDNEGDSDFTPSPIPAQPPRFQRKAQAAMVKRERQSRVGKKTTSRRKRYAKNPDGTPCNYVTSKGEARQYARWNDAERKKLRSVHGPVWCLFCTETAPGPDDKGDFSRVKDTPKRHLLTCKPFRESRYYRKKAEAGMAHEHIVDWAVREQKGAGVIIRCPSDSAQKARLADADFTHLRVLYELATRATIYKDIDCPCCDFPHFSEFRRER